MPPGSTPAACSQAAPMSAPPSPVVSSAGTSVDHRALKGAAPVSVNPYPWHLHVKLYTSYSQIVHSTHSSPQRSGTGATGQERQERGGIGAESAGIEVTQSRS